MKKYLLIFLLICSSLFCQQAPAQSAPEGQKLEPFPFSQKFLMAVMPFEDKTKDQSYGYLGEQIADQLINEIFPYGRYRLIERSKLSALIEEMQVQQTDYFQKDFISKIGHQLGAELMLVGSIVDISQHTEKQSLGIISKQKTSLNISLEARVIYVKTGEIMIISKWSGQEKTSKKRALIATTGDDKSIEDLIAEAIKKGITHMAKSICKDAPEKVEDR